MADLQSLDLRRRSASTEQPPSVRQSIEVAKLIDVSKCIGCKACEVACKEWNNLPADDVGLTGDSYDNALAETINGLYKAELIYRQSWKSREAVEMATLKWVHWYNHQRLLSSIGYIPPAEAEANFHQQQAGQAMAA